MSLSWGRPTGLFAARRWPAAGTRVAVEIVQWLVPAPHQTRAQLGRGQGAAVTELGQAADAGDVS